MDTERLLLQALHAAPDDETTWLALADCVEENGQPERAELLRLQRALPRLKQRPRRQAEARVQQLLLAGVKPCVPALVNSLGMELALIPAGAFGMGSPAREALRDSDEGPRHQVRISRPFYLGVCPVTQAQWRRVMGNNPSYFCRTGGGRDAVQGMRTNDFPVESVTWSAATAFLKKLTARARERRAGRTYRLPTEAEWEYACRAGTTTIFAFGNTLSSTQANFDGSQPYGDAPTGPNLQRTTPVGQYPPNGFGLKDMHGNVWEWCSDWSEDDYYASSPRRDPTGPAGPSTARALRGGCWVDGGWACRSAYRGRRPPGDRRIGLGLRVACDVSAG
jgi:uncharacterized protein (TIGR02996 family)